MIIGCILIFTERFSTMGKKKTEGNGWKLVSSDENEPEKIQSLPPEDQKIKILLEKRKKGKVVTVITNLVLDENDSKKLGKALKNACGVGGTSKQQQIELQGDCGQKAREWLISQGWRVI